MAVPLNNEPFEHNHIKRELHVELCRRTTDGQTVCNAAAAVQQQQLCEAKKGYSPFGSSKIYVYTHHVIYHSWPFG